MLHASLAPPFREKPAWEAMRALYKHVPLQQRMFIQRTICLALAARGQTELRGRVMSKRDGLGNDSARASALPASKTSRRRCGMTDLFGAADHTSSRPSACFNPASAALPAEPVLRHPDLGAG